MAINQVSLFFYPSGWQRLTPDRNALTREGEPVQIADAVRDQSEDTAVTGDDLKDWLFSQGFTVANWGQGGVFERGLVKSIFGAEKAIQVNVGDAAGEIVELYCRFTLPRQTPPPLGEWAAFVAALCQRFVLRLDSESAKLCREAEFIAAVLEDQNYKDYLRIDTNSFHPHTFHPKSVKACCLQLAGAQDFHMDEMLCPIARYSRYLVRCRSTRIVRIAGHHT